MTRAKRLKRIETALTPKQAVLLWLTETRQLGEVDCLEKSLRTPEHEKPRARIPLIVGKAVLESLCKNGIRLEMARQAARDAAKQTDFLIVLVRELERDVQLECTLNEPYVLLLYEKLNRMLEQYVHCDKFEPVMWELWRGVLIQKLCSVWNLRQTIEAISERYFDHQPLLFPEQASRLDDQIQGLEEFARQYNCLEGRIPAWTAIDLAALASSIQEEVLQRVALRVAMAKSKSLEDFGESEAASRIMEPYEPAMLDGLRYHKVKAIGGD